MFKSLIVAAALALVMPLAQADRLKDIASIQGVRTNQLIGYGLVVGLPGTGDQTTQTPFTVQTFNNMLAQFGIKVPPGTTAQLKNVAAVSIHADLPAFAKPGQTIDITVSSIGNSKSLRGGSLLLSPLKGIDGQIYAIAQGNLTIRITETPQVSQPAPLSNGQTAVVPRTGIEVDDQNGRRLGNRGGGRGAMDVFHFRAQAARGFRVVGLDRDAGHAPEIGQDAWWEWLACDPRVGPADEAAFRIDFTAWLAGLPVRKRRAAELLAEGHGTGAVPDVLSENLEAVVRGRDRSAHRGVVALLHIPHEAGRGSRRRQRRNVGRGRQVRVHPPADLGPGV